MKKAFTLVELLIVILVLVTLMSIVFRLSSIGADTSARSTTINRLQRLENCLSGYYAAFGSYPAVRLHNSRSYNLRVSEMHHTQTTDEGDIVSGSGLNWTSVREACRAQPVNCDFPFPSEEPWPTYIDALSAQMAALASEWTDGGVLKDVFLAGFTSDMRAVQGKYTNLAEWREVQIFRFGLLSFLLPRYLFMMEGDSTIYKDHDQWLENNTLPCDPMTGKEFGSWAEVQNYAKSKSAQDLAHVENIPSQIACARWIANLKGICRTTQERTFYGETVSEGDVEIPLSGTFLEIHVPGGYRDGENTSSQYMLNYMKVQDGWSRDFYYYSPPPYQSYILWSGGPNGMTFPPWIDREKLDSSILPTVEAWTADDIMSMSK